jgi:cytoskeletal protein RodZ
MSDPTQELARHLKAALDEAGASVDDIAERTKVPRTTILHLMAQPVSAILPERVYLRGHLRVIAREVGADVGRCETLFDEAFPEDDPEGDTPSQSRFRSQSVAVSATLGGVAVLSVVAAFVSAID